MEKAKPGLEKQTRKYCWLVVKDGDGKWRRKKVNNYTDETVWSEEVEVDGER